MLRIKDQLVASSARVYGYDNSCEFITVHETANTSRGASAQAHADLQSSGNVRNASWHVQTDDVEAIRSYPDSAQCWHAGDGRGPGNLTSLALEICVNADGDYAKAKANGIEVVRQWRAKHGIPRHKVVQHHHWSGKNCPALLRSAGSAAWATFVAATDPYPQGESMAVFVSPAAGRLTSRYGPRERHPVTGVRGFHRGDDIAPPKPGQRGVPLYAAMDGKVWYTVTGRKRGDKRPNPVTGTWNTGNCIVIKTDYGVVLYYGHPDKVYVKAGQRVRAGDVIGTMGDSGNVTGVHLHFEVWANTNHNSNYDPHKLFKKFGVLPGSEPVIPKNPVSPIEGNWLSMVSESQFNARIAKLANDLHLAMRKEVREAVADSEARILAGQTRNAENVHRSIRRDLPGDVLGYKGKGADRDTYAFIRGTYSLVKALADNYDGAARAVASGEPYDEAKFVRGVAQALADAQGVVSFEFPADYGKEVK